MNTHNTSSSWMRAKQTAAGLLTGLLLICSSQVSGQVLAQAPLLTLKTAPGLLMLTMGRDLPLYTAAFNNTSDIDGDGVIDIYFKPGFRYEGYFAVDRCYTYDNAVTPTATNSRPSTSGVFKPTAIGTVVIPDATDLSKNYYKCSGSSGSSTTWSGNFLNYLAMSRMDLLRKVLYGGLRSTDTSSDTVLERSYIPQDSTVWGKQYTSTAIDGYDIRDYTPLPQPASGKKHLFANVTMLAGQNANYTTTPNPPQLNVYKDSVKDLVGLIYTERTILLSAGVIPTLTFTVRVKTCVLLSGTYEDWCSSYPRNATTGLKYKPTGLLHKYGEASSSLAFGLLTGTYDNNYSGGVVRKNVDDFAAEVTASNGTYTSVKGIVYNMNKIRPWGFGDSAGSASWDCGFHWGSQRRNGECPMWGNPLGEMMYETLKYFSGGSASSAYTTGVGTDRVTSSAAYFGPNPNSTGATANLSGHMATYLSPEPSSKLDLQQPAWINPYAASTSRSKTTAYPSCSRPVQMVIGDPRTSFDGDQLPGTSFPLVTNYGPAFSGTVGSLDVSKEADAIWATEFGAGTSKQFFVGESSTDKDGNPTAKTVTSFKNMRGHAPDSTGNQGTYYGASVARYAKITGFTNPSVAGSSADPIRMDQISVALDSVVPNISIPVGGKVVSIVPVSKTIGSCSIGPTQFHKGNFQSTSAITGFFVDTIANVSGYPTNASLNGGRPYYKFRISFADMDYGADNEQDGVLSYVISVTASNTLSVALTVSATSTCATSHFGYVISGTTADGLYLDVGATGSGNTTFGYYLDTMPTKGPGSAMLAGTPPSYSNITTRLSKDTSGAPRIFTPGTSSTGTFVPRDMLWYAAKYGGAVVTKDFVNNTFQYNFKYALNGTDPDSYFLVSNPSKLAAQVSLAFQKAAALSSATSSALSGDGVQVGAGAFLFQASYDTINWGGDLKSFAVDADGNVASSPTWRASTVLPSPSSRLIALGRGGTSRVTLTPGSFAAASPNDLTTTEKTNLKDVATLSFLLGDRTKEQNQSGGTLRNRTSGMGDVVNSDPIYINTADFGYSFESTYAAYKASSAPQLVALGGNDGYYKIISATTGVEKLAFVPFEVQTQLSKLADPTYQHQYYVDGPGTFGHVLFPGAAPSGGWRTVVASSLGAGGKSVFAVNLTSTSTNPSVSDVLWEYRNDNDLGYVVSKPIVGMLEDGATPVVIVPNGLNSTNGKAALLVLNAKTGALIRTCTPASTANMVGNGMGAIAFVSLNNNGKISYVYGADYLGNIWRFDPNLSSGCGAVLNAPLIFSAKNSSAQSQPITGEITVISAPSGKTGYMVLFGTGSYITTSDASTTQVQSLYGIWDDLGTTAATRSLLVQQQIISPSPAGAATGTRTTTATDASTNQAWYDRSGGMRGWYLDLSCSDATICPAGERSVGKPTIQSTPTGSRLWFVTLVPGNDPCNAGGGGWTTSLDPTSGGLVYGYSGRGFNSTYIDGQTPRGLFFADRIATANNPTTSIMFVSVTFTGGKTTTPSGALNLGGTQAGADGNGTAIIGFDTSGNPPPPPNCTLTPPPPGCTTFTPSFGTRRQVWRQIQ
jgi:type IV pilus assembly protein PilY1